MRFCPTTDSRHPPPRHYIMAISMIYALWESIRLNMQGISAFIRRRLREGERQDGRYMPMKILEFQAPLWLEPAPLPRSAQTGGCRLPKLASIAEAWSAHKYTDRTEIYEVDALTSHKLAADLARPFGQSTGRGLSLTRFKIDNSYRTLLMRQQDVFAPWMGPGHTMTPQTLYEIDHLITNADPICRHLQWSEEYPFLVPQMASVGPVGHWTDEEARQLAEFSLPITALDGQTTAISAETSGIHKRLRCALLHKTPCTCPDSVPFSAVRSCPRCDTDFAVNIVPDKVPGSPQARLLVFTTWKLLGDGSAGYRRLFWDPHTTSGSPNRSYSPGHAHFFFESQPRDSHTYSIDRGDIQARVSLARFAQREAPPHYTDVVEESSGAKTLFYDLPRPDLS
ncbi:hypothetical protein QBC39DRAFT_105869 [Podospora conica]|nr:hypothetical protein QBC39DRAFT_105869 [Schizothecium conicum]